MQEVIATNGTPVVVVDRDGTIVRDYPDEQWASVTTPEFLPGAVDGLRALQAWGYGVVVVTNQYLIGEGVISEQQYQDLASQILDGLRAGGVEPLDVYHCPHPRSAACRCRKPGTALVERALAEHPLLTLDGAFVVGDSDADTGLAVNLGIPAICLGEVPPHPLVMRADGWDAVVGAVEQRLSH